MKKIITLCLYFALSLLFLNCGGNSGSGTQYPRFTSGDNELLNFSFPVSVNHKLSGDVKGVIKDTVITLEVPNKTDLTSLVAEYTTNSAHVEVNGIVQASGVTVNDFSKSVQYKVLAENGTSKVYTVVVNVAPSGLKSITSFSLNGVSGKIDEAAGTISVELPPRTSRSAMKAAFDTAGKSVKVGEIVQKSGETVNDFSIPVKYTVIAEDLSVKEYTVTTTVLKDTSKEMASFGFKASDNSSLNTDVNGSISGNTIKLELPFGSSADGLKASFATSGESVNINGAAQQSGITVNNFSSPVEYTVVAENGDRNNYIVTVTIAKSGAKAITKYIIDGEEAVIDEQAKSIAVQFPSDKNLSGLTSAFISTGVSVSVNGVEQVSNVSKNDFSSVVKYIVKADNGSTAEYTVTVTKTESIAGLWDFEFGSDGSYLISGAEVVDGALGNALHFNRGAYVLIPDSDYLTLASEGTIEAVIRADSHQPFAGVVHKGVRPDFSDECYSLQFWGNNGTDGTLRFSIFNEKGDYAYVDSNTKLATGTWYYVTATWNASEIKLYINGSVETTLANKIGKVRSSTGGVVIGAQLPVIYSSYWSNLVFNGTIDKVKISASALTEGKISDTYRSMPFAPKSALTAYILGAASRNYPVVGGIFGILILVLLGIFIYNRKSSKYGS